jgi:hypothetical protein
MVHLAIEFALPVGVAAVMGGVVVLEGVSSFLSLLFSGGRGDRLRISGP